MWNLLERETATHFGILAWRIPWTEDPGRLQSTGSQRVGHNCATILICGIYKNGTDELICKAEIEIQV